MSNKTKKITESAILIAIATVLSFFPKLNSFWVNGGSVTICSMLPIIIISYKYGIKWGCISSLAFAILQLILNFAMPPANNIFLIIACAMIEYFVAFGILGLGGIFRGKGKSVTSELAMGVVFTLTIRFFCHFIAGVIIWGSLVDVGSWQFSLMYNSSYMIPEIIITTMGAIIISKAMPIKMLTN